VYCLINKNYVRKKQINSFPANRVTNPPAYGLSSGSLSMNDYCRPPGTGKPRQHRTRNQRENANTTLAESLCTGETNERNRKGKNVMEKRDSGTCGGTFLRRLGRRIATRIVKIHRPKPKPPRRNVRDVNFRPLPAQTTPCASSMFSYSDFIYLFFVVVFPSRSFPSLYVRPGLIAYPQ